MVFFKIPNEKEESQNLPSIASCLEGNLAGPRELLGIVVVAEPCQIGYRYYLIVSCLIPESRHRRPRLAAVAVA